MVQKTINMETKGDLKSSTMVQDFNAYYPRGHRLSHNTSSKMQTKGSNNKNSTHSNKLKNKILKPTPLYGNAAEPAKKKDKKKRF